VAKFNLVDIATTMTAHGVAMVTYFALFLVLPAMLAVTVVAVLYIIGIIVGDIGGPLFLPPLFAMGLAYAVVATVTGMALFLVTCGIQYLRRYITIQLWVPVVLVFPAVYTTTRLGGTGGVVLSLVLSAAFSTYWLTYSGSGAILNWVRAKLRRVKVRRVGDSTVGLFSDRQPWPRTPAV